MNFKTHAPARREGTTLQPNIHTGTRLGAPISTTPQSRGPDKEAGIAKGLLGAAIARKENKTPRGSRSITALVRGGLWSTLYRLVGGDATWGPDFYNSAVQRAR